MSISRLGIKLYMFMLFFSKKLFKLDFPLFEIGLSQKRFSILVHGHEHRSSFGSWCEYVLCANPLFKTKFVSYFWKKTDGATMDFSKLVQGHEHRSLWIKLWTCVVFKSRSFQIWMCFFSKLAFFKHEFLQNRILKIFDYQKDDDTMKKVSTTNVRSVFTSVFTNVRGGKFKACVCMDSRSFWQLPRTYNKQPTFKKYFPEHMF